MSRRRAVDSFDESDVRTRPNRRGSRPRTKERPHHKDAIPGVVLQVDRGRYRVRVGDGLATRYVTAMKARELGRQGIVVGDHVALVGDTSGRPDTLARLVRVETRTTVLRRTADDNDAVERLLVANVNKMVIVTAATSPTPRPRLIDRCLVAAYDAGIEPALCVTKTDLAEPTDLIELYTDLNVPVLTARSDSPTTYGEVADHLAGSTSVLVGHSGVGKSTLVNYLVPQADRATGHVNEVTGRGRHTSSSAVMLELPDSNGWVIDTPGVRSFGLAHVDGDSILAVFPDLADAAAACPRGCEHTQDDCALTSYATSTDDPSVQRRLSALLRLMQSRSSEND